MYVLCTNALNCIVACFVGNDSVRCQTNVFMKVYAVTDQMSSIQGVQEASQIESLNSIF